ncbi:MAG TPA: hypothetical protein VFC68_07165, partial [Treponemataceae bacterium]|nr:hypothetical protein [Treponemataceae bacterium]
MRKKTQNCILIFFLFFAPIYVEGFTNKQKIYSVSDDIYSNIEFLYINAGLALPSSSGPWTGAELCNMLRSIHVEDMTDSIRLLYKSVQVELYEKPQLVFEKDLGVSIPIVINPELYTHTN